MVNKFKVRDLVRRRVDGAIMVIVDVARFNRGEWKCAWMDGHLRHTDEFTEQEIELHEPTQDASPAIKDRNVHRDEYIKNLRTDLVVREEETPI